MVVIEVLMRTCVLVAPSVRPLNEVFHPDKPVLLGCLAVTVQAKLWFAVCFNLLAVLWLM